MWNFKPLSYSHSVSQGLNSRSNAKPISQRKKRKLRKNLVCSEKIPYFAAMKQAEIQVLEGYAFGVGYWLIRGQFKTISVHGSYESAVLRAEWLNRFRPLKKHFYSIKILC